MMHAVNSPKSTAQIMARFRPIAPRPTDQATKAANGDNASSSSSSSPSKIMESPYLRSVWPHLQARPTRTRKRGRTSVGPTAFKRLRPACYVPPIPFCPFEVTSTTHNYSPAKALSMHAFARPQNGLPPFVPVPNFSIHNATAAYDHPPLNLPVAVPVPPPVMPEHPDRKELDLNKAADVPPEEKDLLQLLGPTAAAAATVTNVVTAPTAIRLVNSSIRIESIGKEPRSDRVVPGPVKAEEIEEEVESECLPVVISDSNNKVRLANSAYKELVGQPECAWLDTTVGGRGVCKRICGEVTLEFPGPGLGQFSGHEAIASNGFFCLVRIEWGGSGRRSCIRTSCDVVRLYCESRDYLFAWRFHTKEVADSASNV